MSSPSPSPFPHWVGGGGSGLLPIPFHGQQTQSCTRSRAMLEEPPPASHSLGCTGGSSVLPCPPAGSGVGRDTDRLWESRAADRYPPTISPLASAVRA